MHSSIDRTNNFARLWMTVAQMTADSQSVVAMRLMGLSGVWSIPRGENSTMITEKVPAYTEALLSGLMTALSGRGPDSVLQAVIEPISEKARDNRTRLANHGPRLYARG